jgi:hypothetical protein
MEQLLVTISLTDRDARLRRDAAAWAHLHPSIDVPEQLPVDLERESLWRRAAARLAVRPTPRRSRSHRAGPRGVVVTPTMTRG